jgi:LruC domain-containing protein
MTKGTIIPAWFALVFVAGQAHAQVPDSDGDGVNDQLDAAPCDASYTSVSSYAAMLLFEDQWPMVTDRDFNDLVSRTHYRAYQDAAGRTRRLRAFFDVVALGGNLTNGLAVQLDVPAARGTVQRRVADGAWQTLLKRGDPSLTAVLSSNMRELFGGRTGPINSEFGQALVNGALVEVLIDFDGNGVSLDFAKAPFDVFMFREDDFPHQIHFPGFSGTEEMRSTLFGQGVDRSRNGRRFVHQNGIPFALNAQDGIWYPREGVAIELLFPDIVPYAASEGSTNLAWFGTNIQTQYGMMVPWASVPQDPAPTVACTYTYRWQTGPYGSCGGGAGTWTPDAWGACGGAPNNCGTGSQSRSHTCVPNGSSGSQSRSVWCEQVDAFGAVVTVLDSACASYVPAGDKPSATQSCTPATAPCGTKPSDQTQACTVTTGCAPLWRCSDWGSCSNVCGGSQTRTCPCQRLFDNVYENTTGCIAPSPTLSQACGGPSGQGYTWIANADWSACSNLCGGTQTQTVWCRENCTSLSKPGSCTGTPPSSSRTCGGPGGLGYAWRALDWGTCSNVCGGTQTRTVQCYDVCSPSGTVADSNCNAATKPATSQSCGGPGGLGYTWIANGDWYGCTNACGGTEYQTVWCRQNCTNTSSPGNCSGSAPSSTRGCGSVDALGGSWQYYYPSCDTCSEGYTNNPAGLWCRRACDGANLGAPSTCYGAGQPGAQTCGANVSDCRIVQTTFWSKSQGSGDVSLSGVGPLDDDRTGSRDPNDTYSSRCEWVGGSGSYTTHGSTDGECWVAGRAGRDAPGTSLGFYEDDSTVGFSAIGNGTNPTFSCGDAGYGSEVSWSGNATYPRSNHPHCSGSAPNRTCYYLRYCN